MPDQTSLHVKTVAINDVLPLEGARRDAIANWKSFCGPGHQRSVSDSVIVIYIHYAAPPYSAGISAIYLIPFVEVWVSFFDSCI